MSTAASRPVPLSNANLSEIIRLTPIPSIDLVIRDTGDRVLLGLRTNEPAKCQYFVPGGRIWKDERLTDAFARILTNETNLVYPFEEARLIGVYEHFYEINRFGDPSYGTHHIALGYEIRMSDHVGLKPDSQHSELTWWTESTLLASGRVHEYTKCYFR